MRKKPIEAFFVLYDMRKFFSIKTVITFFIVFSIGSGIYYGLFLRTGEIFTVKKQDVIERISMTGMMIPAENIGVGFSVDGTVAKIAVRAGDRVLRNDVLAELVQSGREVEIKQYEAKIGVEKAALLQLLSGMNRKEVELLEVKVRAAEVLRESVRRELEDVKARAEGDLARQYALARDYGETILLNADNAMKALGGIYDEHNAFMGIFSVSESRERSDAEWQMMLARTAYANIKTEYAKMKAEGSHATIDAALSNNKTNLEVIRATVFKTAEVLAGASVAFGAPEIGGFITTMMVQRSVINATQTAILTFEQAIAAQVAANQFAVNNALKKVNEADAGMSVAEGELALKRSTSIDAVIAMHQARIREYESSLDIVREDIENSTMRAPLDGVIARVATQRGARVKKEMSVITITPTSDTQVDARVSSDDAPRVRVGDAVHMRWENTQAEGRVVGVASNAIRVHFEDDTVVYSAPQEVTGVIDVVVKHNALMIPKEFLADENNMRSVRVKTPDGIKTVFVLLGMEKGGSVEISEGITEGDALVRP